MKEIIKYLAIIIIATLCSATTTSLITIKPAKPVAVISCSGHAEDIQSWIEKKHRQGYQVKVLAGSDQIYKRYFCIMEKY